MSQPQKYEVPRQRALDETLSVRSQEYQDWGNHTCYSIVPH